MINFKELIEVGAHFGHKTSRWSPKMKQYIWGARNKVHLIDVSKTAFLLNHACTALKKIAESGKQVLWVGTKKSAQATIRKAGQQLSMPVVYHRWIGGTLTNFDQVKKAVTRLLHLRDTVAKPLPSLKKKEIVRLQKEVERLEKNVGGIVDLSYPPAALVIVDAKKEQTSIKEAIDTGIPVIGIVDTNTDPDGVDIVIPANDDSPRAVSFILEKLIEAYAEGAATYAKTHVKPTPIKVAPKPSVVAEPPVKPAVKKHEPVRATTHPAPSPKVTTPAPKDFATKATPASKPEEKIHSTPAQPKVVKLEAKPSLKKVVATKPAVEKAKPAVKASTKAKPAAAKKSVKSASKKTSSKKSK